MFKGPRFEFVFPNYLLNIIVPFSKTNIGLTSTMTTLTDCTIGSTTTDNNNIKPLSEVTGGIAQSPTSPKPPLQTGPKHKLISEADVQVCRLNHTRTIVSKIMNSRYLRRWESHRIVLDHNEMRSTTVSFY